MNKKQYSSAFIEGILIELLKSVKTARPELSYQIGEVERELLKRDANDVSIQRSSKSEEVMKAWIKFPTAELETFNSEGYGACCSIAEAQWKVNGIVNVWQKKDRSRIFFRGEHFSDWPMISSAGRLGFKPNPNEILYTTKEEVEKLKDFQKSVASNVKLFNEIFPDGNKLECDSGGWWPIMQHYKGGTRLIDITSSIFTGLYFACVDMEGKIDEKCDGVLHFFPSSNHFRPASWDPRRKKYSNYFDVENCPDTARLLEVKSRNDRLIAQDGYFLWQPHFDQPMNTGQIFDFRIPAKCKKSILRELYSIGYTAERIVRGEDGSTIHKTLCKELGIDPSNY